MSTAKLSRAEADKIETRVHRLQLLVVVFWVVEVLGLFLVYVTAILGVAEHKAALSISEFLAKHPYLLPCLGVVSATAVILYYINILLLHPFEERLLVAGIVGFAAFLYSEFSDSITKTTADGVADTFQKAVLRRHEGYCREGIEKGCQSMERTVGCDGFPVDYGVCGYVRARYCV